MPEADPDPIRHVTAKTRIYLPGGSHGFRPGETVPLAASVEAELIKAGHLDAPPAPEPAPATTAPVAEPEPPAAAPAA